MPSRTHKRTQQLRLWPLGNPAKAFRTHDNHVPQCGNRGPLDPCGQRQLDIGLRRCTPRLCIRHASPHPVSVYRWEVCSPDVHLDADVPSLSDDFQYFGWEHSGYLAGSRRRPSIRESMRSWRPIAVRTMLGSGKGRPSDVYGDNWSPLVVSITRLDLTTP